MRAQIWQNMPNTVFKAHFWARQILWGISEKILQNTVLKNFTPALLVALVTTMRHDMEEGDDDAREPWQSVRVSHLGPGACEPSRQHT